MNTQTDKYLQSAGIEIDLVRQKVYQQQEPVKLPHLSYLTLVSLMRQAPDIISIDQLIEQVWQGANVSPETVTQRIALLRKTLKQHAHTDFIESVRNKGYRWLLDVQKNTKKSDQKTVANQQSSLIKIFTVLSLAILIIIMVSVYISNQKTNQNPQSSQATQVDTNGQITYQMITEQARRYLEKHDLTSNRLAKGLFEKSLKINPNQAESWAGLSIALSHQVTKFNQPFKLLEPAQTAAQNAIDIDPNYVVGWTALAFMHDAKGESDKAIELYEKALSVQPDHASTISSLAYLYAQEGRLADALRLNLSILGQKQYYLNLQIAQTLDLLDFDDVAEQWYQKADELSPDNVFATHLRARFYLANNQQQKAKELIQQAINRGIKRPELYTTLGIIHVINQQNDRALQNFKKAIATDKQDTSAQLWQLIAQPQTSKLTPKESHKNFESQWLSDTVDHPDLWLNKAIFAAHNDKKASALKYLKQAHKSGYLNHKWLTKLPVFITLQQAPQFHAIIEAMKSDVEHQKQQVLHAQWLPTSFLDPQRR